MAPWPQGGSILGAGRWSRLHLQPASHALMTQHASHPGRAAFHDSHTHVLAAGFQHICTSIEAADLDDDDYHRKRVISSTGRSSRNGGAIACTADLWTDTTPSFRADPFRRLPAAGPCSRGGGGSIRPVLHPRAEKFGRVQTSTRNSSAVKKCPRILSSKSGSSAAAQSRIHVTHS